MAERFQVNKTIQEINEKIKQGRAVVVTADDMVGIVRKKGEVAAAKEVDVVTTGTFSPMCSSGAFINFGHPTPGIKASRVWLNGVPAYGGIAAVDLFIGATEPREDDPLNRIYPGEFLYGGGHLLHDLVAGKSVLLRAEGYGTHCYPRKSYEKRVTLKELPYARLCNPRNAYQNYNCAVNLSERTVFTYMGMLKPRMGNANYCTSGELSPLFNDPYYKTIGIGTRIFLAGAIGYVVGPGTQHNPDVPRTEKGMPKTPAGTLMVSGDMKYMQPEWLVGVSFMGYGCSLAVGIGVPIPILNEEMALYTGVGDDEISTRVVDYGIDYPKGKLNVLAEVTYAELKSGTVRIQGREVKTAPLSSRLKAKQIAGITKRWIEEGQFFLGQPQELLPQPV